MVLNPVISKLSGKLVVLASASPRRLEILRNAGLRFEVVPSWFKETLDKRLFKSPQEYAVETAKQKALEVARRMPFKHLKTPDIVIGADTIVTVDGLILEKPVDKDDAYRMLSRLSGKEHSVFTGVAIVLCHEKEKIDYQLIDFYEETKVKFADLSEDMLWEYINSGEPMDKAGGYGIQALGGMLVEFVHGDFLNVVGFPLNHFCKQLDLIYNRCPFSSDEESASVELHHNTSEMLKQEFGVLRSWLKKYFRGYSTVKTLGYISHFVFVFITFPTLLQALFTASKMGVFDLLQRKPGLDAAQVAQEIKAAVKGTEGLLGACVSLGLLQSKEKFYKNTDLATRYLWSDSPFSLHGYIQHCNETLWPLFSHLESAVREGTNQHERAFGKKANDLFQDTYYNNQSVKLRFMNAMHSIAKVTGKAVATAFDLSSYKTACDLGGCTGAIAYELTKAHPEMSVTVFDLPEVVEMSEHFHPSHTDNRVSFVAGDFFKDELPKADLYILARILHDWPDEKVHILLKKIGDACTPGCAVLLAETMLDGQTAYSALQGLNMLAQTEGMERTESQYADLLSKHGFGDTRVVRTMNFLDAFLAVKM
uniref:Acetylserotonin O-methyltransferase-like n=1 Tax=Sphaeramia orbicularis TaxID=375764 RepID=A0A673CNA7_9TELE